MKPHLPTSTFLLAAALLIGGFASAAEPAPAVQVSLLPTQPLIEQGKHQQLLNFDFHIQNTSSEQIELSGIEVTVLGDADTLLAQYRLGTNGMSVLTIPNRIIEPGQSQLLFNPLYAFPQELDLKHLRFDLRFDVGDTSGKYQAQVQVRPKAFTPKAHLGLPLAGPALVHDGHDFYGHHRRLNLLDPMAQALKWTRNFMRYSYDFVITDAQGNMFKGDGSKNEDWYGWGAAVLAPAAGKVISVVSALPDNAKGQRRPFGREQFVADPSLMWGNRVEIDHGNGEVSLLAHLKQGSVKVKVGDSVSAGQQVGEMGFSGDAFLVHLHYDLKTAAGFDADGLPSPFNEFERLTGSQWLAIPHGQVDSGDVVRRHVH